MRLLRRAIPALILALGVLACAAPKPGADPVAAVAPLYDRYVANQNPPGLLDLAPWTHELRGLLARAMDLSKQQDEPNAVVDFDPIVDGQDWQISDVQVSISKPPADGRAEVVAHFKNFGQPVQVTYELRQEDGGWRIDNIRGEHWTLRQMLADLRITPTT
jgi:Protein of unknown function (DUF3828)